MFAKFELDILVSCPFCDLFVTSSENQNILAMDDSESTVAVSGLSSSLGLGLESFISTGLI